MRVCLFAAVAVLSLFAGSCSNDNLTGPHPGSFPPPSGLESLYLGADSLRAWPWTGTDFSGSTTDPINLVFFGGGNAVQIRERLLALDGSRDNMSEPGLLPDAVWGEAIGGFQTTWADSVDWIGSIIQLQLGTYDSLRVHVRLFDAGRIEGDLHVVIGAAHLEVLVPRTTEHAVISWELAEQRVVEDMVRTGWTFGAVESTHPINMSPEYRTISAEIYNGLPESTRRLIAGPQGEQSEPLPLPNDGRAAVFRVRALPFPSPSSIAEVVQVTLDRPIPNPVCSRGPLDWVLVQGTVFLERTGVVSSSGEYSVVSLAGGDLLATPYDLTLNPPGPVGTSTSGSLFERQEGRLSDGGQEFLVVQRLTAERDGADEVWETRFGGGGGELTQSETEECP